MSPRCPASYSGAGRRQFRRRWLIVYQEVVYDHQEEKIMAKIQYRVTARMLGDETAFREFAGELDAVLDWVQETLTNDDVQEALQDRNDGDNVVKFEVSVLQHPDACPGCRWMPGDGINPRCNDPRGCRAARLKKLEQLHELAKDLSVSLTLEQREALEAVFIP